VPARAPRPSAWFRSQTPAASLLSAIL
jgi:hypothetical protein